MIQRATGRIGQANNLICNSKEIQEKMMTREVIIVSKWDLEKIEN